MDNQVTYVHLAKKIAAITPTSWEYDFDPDEVLKINPFNIVGEVITIPVLVNRMGILVAEMKHYVKEQKIKMELKEAEVRKLFRQKFDKKPSIQETEDHLSLDPVIRNLRLAQLRHEEDLAKIESIHDAAQKKSFNIGVLSKNLIPKEFESEILEGSINGVMVKIRDKQYQK
jgi:hypothetical protein